MSNIDPYGPMTNMRPIQQKSYSAADVRRMLIHVCASCGAKVHRKDTNLCQRCTTELLVEIELSRECEREGEA